MSLAGDGRYGRSPAAESGAVTSVPPEALAEGIDGMIRPYPEVDLPIPSLEDDLEEAADLLLHQEMPDAPDPSTPTDYGDPALIDPAD